MQPPTLRVGTDGRAFASPAAGVRRYVRELFGAMGRVAPEVQILALGAPRRAELPPGVARIPAGLAPPTNAGWMQVGVPLGARQARFGLFHAPAYTAPIWGVRPVVLSIHDVSYARHPEWYPYRRDPVRRWLYRASARSADRILTISEFSRGEIVDAYGVDPASVTVVPLGVAPIFRADPPAEAAAGPPSGSGVPPRYLLHVGDLHVRRNLQLAVTVLARLRGRATGRPADPGASIGPDLGQLGLVLVGRDLGARDALIQRARAAGVERAIAFRDDVSDEELAALYRGAVALIYPSRYEGFGLPLVEAMAAGLPIVAARASCVPEVVGDAGILLDPDDATGFADAVEGIMRNADVREGLRAAGLARARRFTWERTAERTVETYGEVLRPR